MGSSQSSYATTNNNKSVDSSSINNNNSKKNRLLKASSSSIRGRKSTNHTITNNLTKPAQPTTTTTNTSTKPTMHGITTMTSAPHGLRSSVVSMTPSTTTDDNDDHHHMINPVTSRSMYGGLDTTSIESIHSDDFSEDHFESTINEKAIDKPTTILINDGNNAEEIAIESSDDDDDSTEELSDEDDSDEWEEERDTILQDMMQFKKYAMDYLHPEIPIQNTSIACTRNYFTRYAAPVHNDNDDINQEREAILQDMVHLKKYATDFYHPEISVVTTDPTSYGRNYFTRYSAPTQESYDDMLEKNYIFHDLQMLQQLAKDCLHPELPITCTDPTVFGRNYFMRASAPDQMSYEETKVADQIVEDANAFHQLAVEYLHPELPLVIYTTATGRNYYTRASAPVYESLDDMQARLQVMEDLKTFKSLASDYLHPELPIVIYSTSTGRNYFSRPDADEYENLEDMQERERILSDARALKQLAVHYLHPELPVSTTDGTACGRNYFSRFSASTFDTIDDNEYRSMVLADTKMLRQAAVDYMHPEIPVNSSIACARNYYSRLSANDQHVVDVTERDAILADAVSLKKLAVDYMHPEVPVVTTDGTACGRNYFNRHGAPNMDTSDESKERTRILADTAALKKLAFDYLHPEAPVVTTDGTTCGRNYFNRYSAPHADTPDEAEERTRILADTAALKRLAVDYMHPEVPVVTTDGTACGRNYFNRYGAPHMDTPDEAEERSRILTDTAALKKLAVDYMHPELPVITTDGTTYGRNYFKRYSAPQSDTVDEDEERTRILADAATLKKLAIDYMHPEIPVKSTVPCTRNYFDRPSFNLHYHMIHTFPSHNDDDDNSDHHHDEHIDHFGMMDEEMELYNDLRAELEAYPMIANNANNSNNRSTGKYDSTINKADSEVGSNLSRSPSSVFLFGLDDSMYD